MAEKIKVALIIEMMGRPADYLKESLSDFVSKLEAEKGIKMISRKVNEPKEVDGGLFSSFAEIEVEIDKIAQLIKIIFVYMPSHLEIISPGSMKITNSDLNSLLNEMAIRLHEYDSVAKTVLFEKNILINKLKEHGITVNPEDVYGSSKPSEVSAVTKEKISKKKQRKKSR
jgi:hypothetical protein